MLKIDPIIAVKDVGISSKWYQQIFGFKKIHGGNEFAVLASKDDVIMLCLHEWGEHEHPTMMHPNIMHGNGLILYFRTENMDEIKQKLEELDYPIEENIHLNQNSTKMEFSIRDPDGYYLTITQFHKYED